MNFRRLFLVSAAWVATLCGSAGSAGIESLDTGQIEQLTGLKGSFKEEGVFKTTLPRNNIPITVDGWKMAPFMGLTSWAAFTQGKRAEAMLMGDLVLMRTR